MVKNARLPILLLLPLHFSLISCDTPIPIYRPSDSSRVEEPREKREEPREKWEEPKEKREEPKEVDALRQGVVDFARQFVGTDYKPAGKNPQGFDCSGFTGYVMRKFGIELSASSKYQEKDGKMIPVSEVLPGDLLFFRRDKASTVFHVAIVISNDRDGLYVVHSTSSRGVVIDNIKKSSYWSGMYATAGRVIKP